ncbi:MAG: DUF4012 domain-containing protein [Candidatus Liptonbacteria bacterium]|nr:DUF4012 domain-containing protein [Candidatus Liptonbacteria bacterium]
MKRKVPKKNISQRIADIEKRDGKGYRRIPPGVFFDDSIKGEAAQRFLKNGGSENRGKEISRDSASFKTVPLKKFFIAFLVSSLFIVGWFGFQTYKKWNNALTLFSSAGERLGKFTGAAEQEGLNKTDGQKSFLDGFDFAKVKILFGGAGDAYGSFQAISAAALDLAGELDILQNEWPNFIFGNKGEQLIGHLKKIKSDLAAVSEADKKLAAARVDLGSFFSDAGGSQLSLQYDITRIGNFLDALLRWLESANEHHILVLFQNSSEIRPGGGFLGSYADVILKNGNIENIEAHDINDADRELDAKIVPPKPLQAIVTRWRAADANWFFDYSLSSKKIIQFMEASKKYGAGSIKFDGAIAISPKVVSDMLALTGPVQLAGRTAAIDKDNFLFEIQKEVQAGQAPSAGSGLGQSKTPKKILEELTPVLLDKLVELQSNEKKMLFQKFGEWLAGKDLALYFKEPAFQTFFDFYNVSGKVFELPKNFNGDYLAVVNANIGGGKTDLFIKQKVFFKTQLNLDGTASDHLAITREHQGNKSNSWWYRLQNQNYLEVFTLPGAALSNFGGGWDRKIYPKINYKTSGYEVDPLVAQIESGMKKDFNFPLVSVFEESGKNVFAIWVKTDAGKTSVISFDYKVRLFAPPGDSQSYQFVFEKQAGSTGEYQFELYAPVGFRWKENNLPVFEYKTDNPSGRLNINLTFEKAL